MANVDSSEKFKNTAEALTIAKLRSGLTSDQIAEKADIGLANLGYYLRGKVIPRDVRIISGLAQALDIPREWLEGHIERDLQAAALRKGTATVATLALALTTAQCAGAPQAHNWPEFFDRHWFACGFLLSFMMICWLSAQGCRLKCNRP